MAVGVVESNYEQLRSSCALNNKNLIKESINGII